MKRTYIIACFLLLLFSCNKESENDTLLEATNRDVTFCVKPSVSSSGEGEIVVSKSETTPISIASSGNNFRLGLYQNDDSSTPYPNTLYNNIKVAYNTTESTWKYSFGSSSTTTDEVSLSLDDNTESIKVVGCCYTSGYTGITYGYVNDSYDIASIPISSSSSLSTSSNLTCWYMASSELNFSNDSENTTPSVNLEFKPVFAVLKLTFKLKNNQNGVDFRHVSLISTTNKIATGGYLNCVTGDITRNYSTARVLLATTSGALSVTSSGATYYVYMTPNADTDEFTDLQMRFIFDDYQGSVYENTVQLVSDSFSRFESGKVYNLTVEIDNYGQFSDVTFNTEWQSATEDIGTSI